MHFIAVDLRIEGEKTFRWKSEFKSKFCPGWNICSLFVSSVLNMQIYLFLSCWIYFTEAVSEWCFIPEEGFLCVEFLELWDML